MPQKDALLLVSGGGDKEEPSLFSLPFSSLAAKRGNTRTKGRKEEEEGHSPHSISLFSTDSPNMLKTVLIENVSREPLHKPNHTVNTPHENINIFYPSKELNRLAKTAPDRALSDCTRGRRKEEAL